MCYSDRGVLLNNQLRSVLDCIRFSSFDRLEIVSSAVITLLVGDEVRIVVTAIREGGIDLATRHFITRCRSLPFSAPSKCYDLSLVGGKIR